MNFPLKVLFIFILSLILNGCVSENKEEIKINKDGSLIYIKTIHFDKNKSKPEVKKFAKLIDYEKFVELLFKTLIKKTKNNIKGLSYIEFDSDRSINRNDSEIISVLEIKVKNFLDFPRIYKKIRKTNFSSKELKEIILKSAKNQKIIKQLVSKMFVKENNSYQEKKNELLDMTYFFYNYEIEHKYDRKYRLNIFSNMSPEYDPNEEMKHIFKICANNILYTNLNYQKNNDCANKVLSGKEVSKDLKIIFDFEIDLLTYMRLKTGL